LKQKVTTLRALYISHVEAMQNVVRLHKSGSDASFQELSSLISSNGHSVEEVRYAITIEIAYVYLVCLTSILHSCSTIIKLLLPCESVSCIRGHQSRFNT